MDHHNHSEQDYIILRMTAGRFPSGREPKKVGEPNPQPCSCAYCNPEPGSPSPYSAGSNRNLNNERHYSVALWLSVILTMHSSYDPINRKWAPERLAVRYTSVIYRAPRAMRLDSDLVRGSPL